VERRGRGREREKKKKKKGTASKSSCFQLLKRKKEKNSTRASNLKNETAARLAELAEGAMAPSPALMMATEATKTGILPKPPAGRRSRALLQDNLERLSRLAQAPSSSLLLVTELPASSPAPLMSSYAPSPSTSTPMASPAPLLAEAPSSPPLATIQAPLLAAYPPSAAATPSVLDEAQKQYMAPMDNIAPSVYEGERREGG